MRSNNVPDAIGIRKGLLEERDLFVTPQLRPEKVTAKETGAAVSKIIVAVP
jgi:hypothetical protein